MYNERHLERGKRCFESDPEVDADLVRVLLNVDLNLEESPDPFGILSKSFSDLMNCG
jgi:hypothetical protein